MKRTLVVGLAVIFINGCATREDPHLISIQHPGGLEGSLSQWDVQSMFVKNKLIFSELISGRLRPNPNLKGAVWLSFMIQPNGSVDEVEVTASTLNDRLLEKAIAERVITMKFPISKGTTKVTNYPLVLI